MKWFCIAECNFLQLNRKCFLPRLTHSRNDKAAFGQKDKLLFALCKTFFLCAWNLWVKKKTWEMRDWIKGSARKMEFRLGTGTVRRINPVYFSSRLAAWVGNVKDSKGCTCAPISEQRPTLLKPVWFSVMPLVHTSWGWTNRGWWPEDTCYQLKLRSFTGGRWGLHPVFWDILQLSFHLPQAALVGLHSELNGFRSFVLNDKPAFTFGVSAEEQVGECPHRHTVVTS